MPSRGNDICEHGVFRAICGQCRGMPGPGYTLMQASRLTHKIDVLMAKIEDAAYEMTGLVSDHGLRPDRQLEELRELATQLKGVVERRRQH